MATNTNKVLLEKMKAIRARNNEHWVAILSVALEHAPAETKELLRQIDDNDRQINSLLREISKGG
jgi:hypothetical protein